MSAIILAVGVALMFLVLAVGIIAAVTLSNKTWTATFGRHQILLENRVSSEKLYVDGKVVDQHSGLGMNTTLRGQIAEPGGTTHIIEGKIRQGTFGLSIRGYIFVDNQFVGGDQI